MKYRLLYSLGCCALLLLFLLRPVGAKVGDPCTSSVDCSSGEVCDKGMCAALSNCPGEGSPCTVPNQFGACAVGTTQCDKDGGSFCAATVFPSPEICGDGVDNDCDGVTDSNCVPNSCNPSYNAVLFPGVRYFNGQPGSGVCEPGTIASSPNGMTCVGGAAPAPEIQDGLDNDCNGIVDDVLNACNACQPTAPYEICDDKIDNDCNGATDCSDVACIGSPGCAGSVCGDGKCDPGEENGKCPVDCGSGCQPTAPYEICDDKIDNDCNGVADCGDPACTGTPNCFSVTICGDGKCESGESPTQCPMDCGGVCQPTEICGDFNDNDCNGLIDCGDPACANDPITCPGSFCGDGKCDVGVENQTNCGVDCPFCDPNTQPAPEVCDDKIDNDCNGNIDCQDPSCAGAPNCFSVCGNGQCDPAENSSTCPIDCGGCHDVCVPGDRMLAQCSSCATQVCAADPFCCNSAWDGICVSEAMSICNLNCVQVTCGDGVCAYPETPDNCAIDCGPPPPPPPSCQNQGAPCEVPNTFGSCSQGTTVCDPQGSPVCVSVTPPYPETCDGIDNDCDGVVDNNTSGFFCYTGMLGACGQGVLSCESGVGSCIPIVAPVPEVCDGIDNDCNGAVDDNANCPTQCGNGVCEPNETPNDCPVDCGPPVGYCGNGLCEFNETPNNCAIDCGPPPPVCGDGMCSPSENKQTCPLDCFDPVGCCGDGICDARIETPFNCDADCFTCSSGTADCDKNPSNKCETNIASDITNCGACGNQCPGGSNAVAACENSQCALSCNPGYADCDKDPSNGCEVNDQDGDGVICGDNCPNVANPTQADWNKNGVGDACAPTSDCSACVNSINWGKPGSLTAATNQCNQIVSFDNDNKDKRSACSAKCNALLSISKYLPDSQRQCLLSFCSSLEQQMSDGLRCVP